MPVRSRVGAPQAGQGERSFFTRSSAVRRMFSMRVGLACARMSVSMKTCWPSDSSSAQAKGQVSASVVEGFNNKAKVITRRAFGFRTFRAVEIALYHGVGPLPEPEATHRFC